jgi:hypothetical protein
MDWKYFPMKYKDYSRYQGFRGQQINYEENRCYVVAVVCFR